MSFVLASAQAFDAPAVRDSSVRVSVLQQRPRRHRLLVRIHDLGERLVSVVLPTHPLRVPS